MVHGRISEAFIEFLKLIYTPEEAGVVKHLNVYPMFRTAQDVAAAFDGRGLGAIVNSARGVIFAHQRPEYAKRFGSTRWQEAVEAATREMIAELRAETPAGKLKQR